MNEYTNYTGTEPLTLTLCLDENSILVSRAILEALEHPKQIQMLINDERKMLLLKACTIDEREAVVIPPEIQLQFEMSGHSLLKRVRRLTGWTDNTPRAICGSFLPAHQAIVFDLTAAQPTELHMPTDEASGVPN